MNSDRHSELFVQMMLDQVGAVSLEALPDFTAECALALPPIVIDDFRILTDKNREDIATAYNSRFGVAYFIVRNPEAQPRRSHALFDVVEQLAGRIPFSFPLPHPMEGHSEAVKRWGSADGTVKIYNLPGKGGAAGYREQAETNETFDMHHDGLGSGGTVETVVLYMDKSPMFGGYTYFHNVPLLALQLARKDREAFQSLFLPDAVTIVRPRGKGAIKVKSPILFINDDDRPQSFFRRASGEYTVTWRKSEELDRAKRFFDSFTMPFAGGSSFVHLSGPGHACIMNNQLVAHARTPFQDDPERGILRLLSRKWFMRTQRDSVYKHVPGMFVSKTFANEYSQICAPELLQGEWLYDIARDTNVRIK